MLTTDELVSLSSDFVAHESGLRWIEENPEFVERVGKFCAPEPGTPEDAFDDYPFIGMGQNSDVRSLGDVAVKVSTYTTGKRAHELGFGVRPEDLIGQFKLLSALGEYLEDSHDVTVPRQHFALSTSVGNIRGETHMVGWSTLETLVIKRKYTRQEEDDIYVRTKERLNKAIGNPLLRIGLDLGIGKKELIKSKNILMPDDCDPETGKLCIIDQPASYKFSGRLAVPIHCALATRGSKQMSPLSTSVEQSH
jgi:hypothetical protein